MSDPVEYMRPTLLGPGATEALRWLRRAQRWERRQAELAEGVVHPDDDSSREPLTAA